MKTAAYPVLSYNCLQGEKCAFRVPATSPYNQKPCSFLEPYKSTCLNKEAHQAADLLRLPELIHLLQDRLSIQRDEAWLLHKETIPTKTV